MSKKVIIVGNSPSVLSQKLGNVVDSHDIVIRINKCITKGYEEKIGEKINIWATTKNEDIGNFIPDAYDKLDHIWLRTWRLLGGPTSNGQNLNLPDDPDIPKHVMFKTPEFTKNDYFQDLIKDLKHEPCTGLLTILTATLFYEDISLLGFTFYTDLESQKDNYEYYREREISEGGADPEDGIWEYVKASGFCSQEEGFLRQQILKKLINNNKVKMLNPKELEG